MRIDSLEFTPAGWSGLPSSQAGDPAQLVLVFGDRFALERGDYFAPLRAAFPDAAIVSCSGGGVIAGARVATEGIFATALTFASSTVHAAVAPLPSAADSERVGRELAGRLPADGLRHVLVFSEGLAVNGSELARGFAAALPATVAVTGGLAADDDRFVRTAVGLDGPPAARRVVAVGLYGDRLSIGVGSFGGWEEFGPDRAITRAEGNTLLELDGRNALELYRELLGPLGYALPASGLRFPLKVRESADSPGVLRTILGVDEARGGVVFAGDVPEGWTARLVRTSLDRLIAAASVAGEASRGPGEPTFALAVSCIGRRLLLQQRVGEEVERVRRTLGAAQVAGFYAYGELAPSAALGPCELHNQTMTITTFAER